MMKPMAEFVTVATVQEVPPGASKVVYVQGEMIAIFNVDGRFFAIDNTCPHRGGPLGAGYLDGTIVRCPLHYWPFDLRTGESPGSPVDRVLTYAVRLEGDQVQVEV